MGNPQENEVKAWCLDCEDEPDGNCFVKRHDVVTADTASPIIPDLTGTPAPQHTDVRHF